MKTATTNVRNLNHRVAKGAQVDDNHPLVKARPDLFTDAADTRRPKAKTDEKPPASG